MRRALMAGSIAVLFVFACSDPPCQPGERKVADVCVITRDRRKDAGARRDEADGSKADGSTADGTGSMPSSSSARDADAGRRDASQVRGAACSDDEGALRDATCIAPDDACIGNAGKAVCEGLTLIACDADGVALGKEACASDKHCQQGRASGACAQCLAGEHRCAGRRLEACGADGQGWELVKDCPVEAPCNAEAAACTSAACLPGGKRCTGDMLEVCNEKQTGYVAEETCRSGLCDDVDGECKSCIAGAKRCEGTVALSCANDGLRETRMTCPARCAGSGECVECVEADDCLAPSTECRVSTCSAAGKCGEANAQPGTSCATGTCSAGTCRCSRNEDCGPTEVCSSGACVANRCGDGVQGGSEQCDDGNRSNADACLNDCKNARCGDGFLRTADLLSIRNEECDATASEWNSTTCFNCGRALYIPCTSNAQCPTTGYCAQSPYGFCTTATNQCSPVSSVPAGCEAIPGWSLTCSLGVCSVACDGARCPAGLTCGDAAGLPGVCIKS